MKDASVLLNVLFYLVIGTSGLGAVFALFRARYIKATVEELRGDRDDQILRIERLEKERTEALEGNIRRDLIIKEQTEQIIMLKEALSGRAQIDHLQEQLDAHDKRVDERHAALTSQMARVVNSNLNVVQSNEKIADSNEYLQAALIDLQNKLGAV